MTDEETNAILAKAEGCMGEECSIDEVDELLAVLKDTQGELESRLGTIVGMIGKLQHLNEKDERQVDDVREFVRDMLRVFSTDVSIFLYFFLGCQFLDNFLSSLC